MPGCVLRVTGRDFDPDAFLAGRSLTAYKQFRRGDHVAERGPRAERVYETSGFYCEVSAGGDDLNQQASDAIQFLDRYRDDLVDLADFPGVEDRRIDFGYACRIGGEVAAQFDYLPPELLSRVAPRRIGIELSLYPPLAE